MKFGLRYCNTGRYVDPARAVELMQAAEAAGFDSAWTVEHTVIPRGYQSAYPYTSDGRLPGGEGDFLLPDPLIWMAYVAAATSRIKLATGILILPQHNPVIVAKQVATLDHMANGRILLGIGVGWLKEEFDAIGAIFENRGRRTDEYIAAMRELWSKPAASFHGKYANFDDIVCNPKPVQQPGPPVLIGSADKNALKRVARWADGYIPVCFETAKAASFMRRNLAELKAECDKNGRDFGKLDITVMASLPAERSRTQELIAELAELRVNRVVDVNAIEPLFVGDYRRKVELIAKAAL
jgi:probable F420-dependent oxidoreductase